MVSRVGLRIAAQNTALGKAILAQQDESALAGIFDPRLRMTPKSLRDEASFREAVKASKSRGYGIDNEEATLGVMCIAVALPQLSASRPPAAISVSVPLAFMDDKLRERIVATLSEHADRIAAIYTVCEFPGLLI